MSKSRFQKALQQQAERNLKERRKIREAEKEAERILQQRTEPRIRKHSGKRVKYQQKRIRQQQVAFDKNFEKLIDEIIIPLTKNVFKKKDTQIYKFWKNAIQEGSKTLNRDFVKAVVKAEYLSTQIEDPKKAKNLTAFHRKLALSGHFNSQEEIWIAHVLQQLETNHSSVASMIEQICGASLDRMESVAGNKGENYDIILEGPKGMVQVHASPSTDRGDSDFDGEPTFTILAQYSDESEEQA